MNVPINGGNDLFPGSVFVYGRVYLCGNDFRTLSRIVFRIYTNVFRSRFFVYLPNKRATYLSFKQS